MHNKFKSLLPFLPVAILTSAALCGCSKKSNDCRVLRILNCEDYIYEYDDSDESYEGMDKRDMIDQFADYWKEKTGDEIEIVYDTFDTNETMFNELETGKTTYDVIVPSDYMIQKLLSNDMLHKFSDHSSWGYIPGFLQDRFQKITAKSLTSGEESSIFDYAVPYMWGTVGMMYNPNFYVGENFSYEEIHKAFQDWDSLYTNEYLNRTYSIKDSVREAYAVSLIHSTPKFSELDNNDEIAELFNMHDDETMARVKEDMLKLKKHAFGFECDSGKTDMTTQKIGANLCWSGDATWAITEARPETDDNGNIIPDSGVDLYYVVPTFCTYYDENGDSYLGNGASNIWFDGFCMPKNETSDDAQYELAEAFIYFMSQPENAMQNCFSVGYTPAVAGDDMLNYMYECYDVRESLNGEIPADAEYVEYDLSYFYADTITDSSKAVLFADPDYIGRELTAQYPLEEDLNRLAVMEDFGKEGNESLLHMWEQVRTNSLPTWGIVLICVESLAALCLGAYFITKKVVRKNLKQNR